MLSGSGLVDVVCIGPWGSGKTALLRRYASNLDTPNHISTVNPDFSQATLRNKQEEIKITFWEIGGGKTSFTLTTVYARAAVALIVVDLSNLDHLSTIGKYQQEILDVNRVDADIVLVGTHDDLRKNKDKATQVNAAKKILQQKAQVLGCRYFFVDNHDKKTVDPVFTEVHRLILEKKPKEAETLQRASDSKRAVQKSKPVLAVVDSNLPIMAKRIRPRFRLPSLPKNWKEWAYPMALAAFLLTTLVLVSFSTFGVFPAMVTAIGVASWLAPSLVAVASMSLGATIGGLYHWASNKRVEHREMLARTSTDRNVFQFLSGKKQPPENNSPDHALTVNAGANFPGFISARSSATTQIGADTTSQIISPSTNRTFT